MNEGTQNKPVQDMTEKEFRSLPHRGWNEAVAFTALVILPAKYDLWGSVRFALKSLVARLFHLQSPEIWEVGHLHDSGYRCLSFVAVDGSKPLCRLAGCSDAIHVDGIGGYGRDWLEKYSTVPDLIPPSGWSIDCLPKSGLLRMWPSSGRMTRGPSLSPFEIYALEAERESDNPNLATRPRASTGARLGHG